MRILTSLAVVWMISMAVSCARVEIDDLGPEGNYPPFPKPTEQIDRVPLTRAEQGFVQAGNAFAWKMAADIWKTEREKGSLILSPLSVQYALGMLGNGASGETAALIARVLGYEGREAVNAFCAKLMADLPKVDTTVTLALANAVLADERFSFNPDFRAAVEGAYDAEVAGMPFSNPDKVLERIDAWCREHTYGRIDKILDSVSPADLVYLMNAIYFNARWSDVFDTSVTRSEKFTRRSGKSVTLKMMHKTRYYPYSEDELCQHVSLPYGNGRYQMDIYLPKRSVSLEAVINSAPAANPAWPSQEVILSIPRFETRSSMDLMELLSGMGIPRYPYGGIIASETDLAISQVKQKAFIRVDETGSEAAAVTIIGMYGTSAGYTPPPPVTFTADHSFLYTISETSSGVILFIGVYDGD